MRNLGSLCMFAVAVLSLLETNNELHTTPPIRWCPENGWHGFVMRHFFRGTEYFNKRETRRISPLAGLVVVLCVCRLQEHYPSYLWFSDQLIPVLVSCRP